MEQTLSNRIAVFRNGRVRVEQQLENERRTITRLTTRIDQIKEESIELAKAVSLLDRCIEVVSINGIGKIESIVSAGLRKVFKDNTLGLVVEKKETARGYSYRLLIKQGDTLGNPMDSFGGGVQNVTAFLLRVILIKRFKLSKAIFLDESFSNVSSEFLPQVSNMLRTLVDNNGFTILTVSHQPLITACADKVYRVQETPKDGPLLVEGNVDEEVLDAG
jgi:DNA repair exonuclease SbcCD ATPase subunit